MVMPISESVQPESDIDALAAQLNDLAVSRQLALIPAIPLRGSAPGFVAFLGAEHMRAGEFCDVAVVAGAKLLYADVNAFDAETDLMADRRRGLGWQSDEEDSRLLALRQEASIFNGRIGEIVLGFAVNGVLHCWRATTPWYHDFVERLEEVDDVEPMDQRIPEAEERALIDRLVEELIQLPGYRSASTMTQRRRIARALPEISALEADRRPGYHSVAFQVLSKTQERAAAEADSKYREMEAEIADLAAECAASPAFRSAGSARARRERARDFLAEKAGGYPPSARLLELFLDTPPLQSARRGRH
jgi:hypothetical protein